MATQIVIFDPTDQEDVENAESVLDDLLNDNFKVVASSSSSRPPVEFSGEIKYERDMMILILFRPDDE